jgi:hypothetical protein
MRDHEAAMCAYAQLAALSHEKQQALSRDRFLLLTGVEACRAGWPAVAMACHASLMAHRSPIQVTLFASFEDALRDEDFRRLADHWERWCPFERAEHLLADLGRTARVECGDEPLDRVLIEQLSGMG